MGEAIPVAQFFVANGMLTEEEFLEKFKGAFLLTSHQGTPPMLYELSLNEDVNTTIGQDEDNNDIDFNDPTLDEQHAIVSYHTGFRGWTIEDLGTSFGTNVDGDRIGNNKATLLQDRVVINPGGGLTQLQFYLAKTLYDRMHKAGVTKSLRRKQGLDAQKKDAGKAGEKEEEKD